MNRRSYERECLIRSPEFRADLEQLQVAHPRLFNPGLLPKDERGKPEGFAFSAAETQATRAFEAKYPAITGKQVSMVLQPYPLVFDPAWKVCADNAHGEFHSRKGSPARGLVTRHGVEPDGESGSREAEIVHRLARRRFGSLPEESRDFFRRDYGPAIFKQARVLLPIGPETTLEQVKGWWRVVQRGQRACYGAPVRKRAPRRNILADRIQVYDLVRTGGVSVSVAARRTGLGSRMILRRLWEATVDIEGSQKAAGKAGPEEAHKHKASCRTCQRAEKQGDSNLYCRWMQRYLGSRSGRIKNRASLESEENNRGKRWRRSAH